jgi:hypothetical protein
MFYALAYSVKAGIRSRANEIRRNRKCIAPRTTYWIVVSLHHSRILPVLAEEGVLSAS